MEHIDARRGSIGIVSRSASLTSEIVLQTTLAGLGQSTTIGVGGDPIHGLGFIDILERFEQDSQTKACIMIGEIGGSEEELAAKWIAENFSKPVTAFIAGRTAPPGRRMGHAGALISGGADTADAKLEVMEACGFTVTRNPSEMAKLLKGLL